MRPTPYSRVPGLVCLLLGLFPTTVVMSQTPAPPASSPQAAPASTPHVDSVVLFPQASQPGQTTTNQQSIYVLEINGTGFNSVDMSNLRIILFPATGVSAVSALSRSLDNSKVFAQFTAPANYVLEQVALSLSGSSFITFNTNVMSCDFDNKVVLTPEIVSQDQTKTKYGNGVAANFYVIQISMVNKCSMPIVVPLAGIKILPKGENKKADCDTGGATLVPFSLDHLTSIYSADRKLTGKRAIYFNSIQALATIGSAVEPFFAHGFTQGVAILGGGFTTASKEIFVDMSTEQLQNITSQSFGATEQIASGGPLQKFVFVPKSTRKVCRQDVLETNLRTGNFNVTFEVTPSSQPPTSVSTSAKPTARAQ
jgi:hypothetical protein